MSGGVRAQSAPRPAPSPFPRAQSAPSNRPHMRTPAPQPLPTSLSPAMVALMSEIVIKPAPKPVKLRPTQMQRPTAPSEGAGTGLSSVWAKPRQKGQRAGPARIFNSQPPPEPTVPSNGGFFERLTAAEARDRLDGSAGTTLPSAEALSEYAARAHVAAEVARAERQAVAIAEAEERRAEAALKAKMEIPESQKKFGWTSNSINTALLTKMDQFTSRHEDQTRKILWTFGTDPHLADAPKKGQARSSALKITPDNFPRVCDRFGIKCDKSQGAEIFAKHGLPAEGVSMQKLSSKLIDNPLDMAVVVREQARKIYGDVARPAAAMRNAYPTSPRKDRNPYQMSHMIAAGRSMSAKRPEDSVAAALGN
jgi:hypothetical protein